MRPKGSIHDNSRVCTAVLPSCMHGEAQIKQPADLAAKQEKKTSQDVQELAKRQARMEARMEEMLKMLEQITPVGRRRGWLVS